MTTTGTASSPSSAGATNAANVLPQQIQESGLTGRPIETLINHIEFDEGGDHVFSLLEGTTGRPSSLVPGREGRKWMRVTSVGDNVDADQIASRLHINPEFAGKLHDTIAPGTTVIVTDRPVVRKGIAESPVFAAN